MQQLASRPRPDQQTTPGGAPRSQVVLIVALLLFSVAGLASGFSVGALTGKHGQATQSTPITNTIPAQKGQGATPIPKPTFKITSLGCPQEGQGTSAMLQQSDGTTSYTFIAQAIDQQGKVCSAGQPIHGAGIALKLWVTQHIPVGKFLGFSANEKKVFLQPDHLNQTIDGNVDNKDYPELTNALQFDGKTPQVLASNNQGQGTWHYKINQGLPDGKYSLVLLVSGQGKYNWSWFDLEVKKQV